MESKRLFSLDEAEYLQIFENMQEEIHVHELVRDKQGKIVDFIFKYINPASTLNSIISREKVIGKKASVIYKSHEALIPYLKIADEVVTTGKSKKFETYFEPLDKHFLISAFSINELYVTLGIDITEQKEAEEQIRIQADILSQVRDAVIAVDNENRIAYWNKGAEKLYGFKSEEVEGKIFADVVNYRWLNLDDKKKAYRQLKTIGEWHGENLSTKKNGEEIHVESSINAFKDNKGNYIGTISIIHDITEPVHIKKALEKNYKQLQEAQRIGHIGNWEWDIQNNIITWSDELYNIFGLDPNQFGAKYETILSMVHPEDRYIVNETIEKALEDHKPFMYEVRIRRQDGDVRVILCRGEVVTDFAGHPVKIICVEQDITERKKNEEALRRAKNELEIRVEERTKELKETNELLQIELEERKRAEDKLKKSEKNLAKAQEIAHLGNWNWNVNTNKLSWSDEIYRIFGLTPGEFDATYEAFLNLVYLEDRDFVDKSVKDALNKGKHYKIDHRIILPDGSIRIVHQQAEITFDNEGNAISMIGTIQDVTERKHAEEELKKLVGELKRSNDELQQFAYVSSHDLQEPLRTITSFTQLLERRYKDKLDSDADEFIGYIVDAAKRMQNLINDLLDYSRVATRGKEFKLTDTEEILENTMSNLHAAIGEGGATITHDPLPEIMADSRQLLQLFQNLIGNAIKFRKPEVLPKIHISAREDKENKEYVFSVQDNGIGMESQHAERIFIIFQRLHTREEYNGTGIGLAIAKRIIERHGGKIWAESEPRVGSTFYFTIPIK